MTSWLAAWPLAAGAAFLGLVLAERRWPLRQRIEQPGRRLVRNAATGGLALAVVQPIHLLMLLPLSAWTQRSGIGLLHVAELPRALHVALAVLLLDYTLWHWHRLSHVVPFLWRFHLAHHVDLDLDASTALRFHFGEHLLSVPWRALQVLVIGVDPLSLMAWNAVLFPSIFFHHSNLRLPRRLEQALVRLVVTPRMHGIHHSTVREERNSNYASMVTAWDALHGTLRLDVPQESVTIGVPGWDDPAELRFGDVQALPFRKGACAR